MNRGNKIYEPPRYMSIPTAVSQLLSIESKRKSGILSPSSTLAIGVSRVGGGSRQTIVAGTLEQLAAQPEDKYGEPLHSLVIVGKRLHHLEVEYAEEFAVDPVVWTDISKRMYGCTT